MTVNFGQGKQQQQQQQQQAAGRYNFIDFENSCEWGAPNSIRKPPDFYSELIRELQDYSEKAMKDA